MRLKAPAQNNIGIDIDGDAVRRFLEDYPQLDCELFARDAYSWLQKAELDLKTLVYCDPPYVHSTRTSSKRYRYEMTDGDHDAVLKLLKNMSCMVMVSGYRCDLYDNLLSDWFSLDYQAMSHGGVRTETVWCNFDPGRVHYHTYAGKDFTDRQRIKRKAERWATRYAKLPPGEQQSVLAAILAVSSN